MLAVCRNPQGTLKTLMSRPTPRGWRCSRAGVRPGNGVFLSFPDDSTVQPICLGSTRKFAKVTHLLSTSMRTKWDPEGQSFVGTAGSPQVPGRHAPVLSDPLHTQLQHTVHLRVSALNESTLLPPQLMPQERNTLPRKASLWNSLWELTCLQMSRNSHLLNCSLS